MRIDLVLADYRKKSTGVQAATLAPGSIGIHAFPKEIPLDWDPRRSLVVFPSEDAVTLDEIDPQELAGVERFVLLDSRWNNTTRVRLGDSGDGGGWMKTDSCIRNRRIKCRC